MTDVQFWQGCYLVLMVSFAVVFVRGCQIYRERNRAVDECKRLDQCLDNVRTALELPSEIEHYSLASIVSGLFKEHRRLSKKYLDLKTKWQEVDARTIETKKVFGRALKQWQTHHKTVRIPHLNELVDWLAGGEQVTNQAETIEEVAEQMKFVVHQSQKLAEKLEWLQTRLQKERSV